MADETQWDVLWETGETFWEKHGSPPALMALLRNPNVAHVLKGRGLVPGCGSGHDAISLAEIPTMTEVIGLDIVDKAIEKARKKAKSQSNLSFVNGDFFTYVDANSFDVIIDHTFLCALPPARRQQWADKINALLRPGGALVTYIFPLATHKGGPPFAVSLETYDQLLGNAFEKIHEEDVPRRFHTWMSTVGERVAVFRKRTPA